MRYDFRYLCMLLVFSLLACNNKKTEDPVKKDTDLTYIYKFTDSSMPPQYHRSYVILVTRGWVYFTIDSYGNILLKDSSSLAENAYKDFTASISKLNIRNRKEEKGEECTGGTTDEFKFYAGTSEQVKGYSTECAGKRNGNIEGDVEAAKELFRTIVPDFNKKIESTRKEG